LLLELLSVDENFTNTWGASRNVIGDLFKTCRVSQRLVEGKVPNGFLIGQMSLSSSSIMFVI
jgi:hypothetical protein